MRLLLISSALLIGLASPVLANQCPRQLAALDEKSKQHGSMLTPQQQTQVKELRAQALTAHNAGRHDEALQNVQEALEVIGM
ncbi:hypothetical protein JL100_000670 [Skermanella mucosa]|uniref:hypothetical protein n=1 Tax=Skermanella mucosa TaxID=1789672 RepID=UPI00192B9DFD|nr:hypothetical protein [Skermanella mucosa]UEM21335.1 hypothetical protein JL100_000670 [Skermanella mucosa]